MSITSVEGLIHPRHHHVDRPRSGAIVLTLELRAVLLDEQDTTVESYPLAMLEDLKQSNPVERIRIGLYSRGEVALLHLCDFHLHGKEDRG